MKILFISLFFTLVNLFNFNYVGMSQVIQNERKNDSNIISINSIDLTNIKVVSNPLSGDYTVGISAFNSLSGKNLKYEKFIRTVTKETEVITNKPYNKKLDNNKISSEYFEILSFVPEHTIKKEVTEEYYVLMESGKIYDGPLSVDYPNQTFATLTEAINNLNSRGVSGNVRFLLTDTLYNEAGTMTINITGSDTTNSSRTFTLRPNVNVSSVKIATNSSSPVFVVNESYIIFDGSNSEGGITRNMTITNLGTASSSGCAGATGVSNITFKNLACSTSGSSVSYDLLFDSVNTGLVENCALKKATTGIQVQSGCNNFTIRNNDIGSSIAGEKIQNTAIAIISTSNFTVENNRIIGLERPYSISTGTFGSVIGILVRNQFGGASPSNGSIIRNTIQNIKHTGIDEYAYSALGIRLSSESLNSNITVANNFISDILGDGDAGVFYNPHGIFIDQGGGYNIYFNSINMFGNVNNAGLLFPAYTGAITIYPGTIIPRNLDIRSNTFNNSQTIAFSGSKAYAIYSGVADTSFSLINFNGYYSSGINGTLGFLGSNRGDIASWRNATGKDSNSISVPITFTSSTNLHLSGGSVGNKNLTVSPIPGITTDIDNESRQPEYPYIGADEVPTSPLAITLNLTLLIEGFLNGSTMIPDTVTVYLANTVSPFLKKDSARVLLDLNGFKKINFLNTTDINFFIIIKHRNSIETWSKNPQLFLGGLVTYDFTSAADKAFGDNMKQISSSPAKFGFYGGDIAPQDGLIDLTDDIAVINDVNTFGSGPGLATDLTGDESVDLSDIIIVVNNSNSFISKQTPEGKNILPLKSQKEFNDK